jgi:DNA-directed RNA polymerase subunit beta
MSPGAGSKKKSLIHQKLRVQGGKCVKKDQILADGAATVGGELVVGKNILVAYMPWEGYNSQDVVLISERLIYEYIVTSFSIWRYEIKTYIINWFDTNNGSRFSM